MRFDAVIFDLDGTLLDTLGDITVSLNHALAQSGFAGHSPERVKRFIGDGAPTLVRRALPEQARDEATIGRINRAFVAHYLEHWDQLTAPFPGIPELLDRLSALGLPLGVLSNKPDAPSREMVARLLCRWRFAEVRGAREDTPLKPDPTAALDQARRLGVDPARTLFVGDSDIDMITARRAGMAPLGVLWGFRDAEELSREGARWLAEQPAEIAAIVADAE